MDPSLQHSRHSSSVGSTAQVVIGELIGILRLRLHTTSFELYWYVHQYTNPPLDSSEEEEEEEATAEVSWSSLESRVSIVLMML